MLRQELVNMSADDSMRNLYSCSARLNSELFGRKEVALCTQEVRRRPCFVGNEDTLTVEAEQIEFAETESTQSQEDGARARSSSN